jgi:hypothetical protein
MGNRAGGGTSSYLSHSHVLNARGPQAPSITAIASDPLVMFIVPAAGARSLDALPASLPRNLLIVNEFGEDAPSPWTARKTFALRQPDAAAGVASHPAQGHARIVQAPSAALRVRLDAGRAEKERRQGSSWRGTTR